MTVFVYVNTSKQVGDAEHVKVFATTDAAETWLRKTIPRAWRSSTRFSNEPRAANLVHLMKPERKRAIGTGIFNIVFALPFIAAAKLAGVAYMAIFPFLNFRKMAHEEGVLFALFITLLSLPAVALIVVIVLAIAGRIPLY